MKCPNCDNSRMNKFGVKYNKYSTQRQYKCGQCGKRVSELISGTSGLGFMKSFEYARTMSQAQLLRYKEATPEDRKRWADAHRMKHSERDQIKALARRKNFIGMLGDIEVYATDFGRVGRGLPGAPANWVRHAHGKPELKVRKPG